MGTAVQHFAACTPSGSRLLKLAVDTSLRAEQFVDVPPHEIGGAIVKRQASQRVDNPELRLRTHRRTERKMLLEVHQIERPVFERILLFYA